MNENTKLISLTHCSNIVGSINPINEIVSMAHAVGAKVVVDGVSYAPHSWPDVSELDVDAYSFSTYKTFGTHQGVMYVKPEFMKLLSPQCHFYSSGYISSYLDAAGPDHASIAALAGLADFIEAVHQHHFTSQAESLQQKASAVSNLLFQHELSLCALFLEALSHLPVRIIGKTTMQRRETNVAFIPEAFTATELADLLAEKGVVASPSHFDGCRLLKKLGVDPDQGVLRVSFAAYNSLEDTETLIKALNSIL